MIVFITPFILYLLCIILLKKLIPFLTKMSLIDYPTKRSNHSLLIPKGGGILIIPLLIFSISLIFSFKNILSSQWIIFLLSLVILFSISLIDDIKNLSAPSRLLIHFISVAVSIFALKNEIVFFAQKNILPWINFDPLVIFYLICIALTVLWIWVINLFNFMDGMDGLTCAQVFLLATITNLLAVFGHFSENFQYLSLVLISLFLAFFKFNKPPAKIFLGDVGSIPIGYLTGLILVKAILNNGPLIPIVIALLFYFFDSTITLIIRLTKKKKIMVAHSDHFYQKILRAGQTHHQVLKRIIILFIVLLVLSMLSLIYPMFSLLFSIVITLCFLIYLQLLSKK